MYHSDKYDTILYSTPMHAIISNCCRTKSKVHNCTEMAKILLSKNIQNINVQCPITKYTIMHYLVRNNQGPCQEEMIRLIAPHSDLNIKNCSGLTAIDVAKQNEMDDVVEFLTNLMTTTMEGNDLKRGHDNNLIFPNKKLKIM